MKYLYYLIPLLFLAFFTPSCKKYIQQQEQKAAMAIITDGVWYVSQYLQNDSNITASFSGYLFKFDANSVVTGTRDSVSVQGTWSANIASRSIYSNFPTAGDPVKKLNETWTITDSSPTYVAATSTDSTSHSNNILHLQKQ
jgi:hypothetical protein